MAKEGKAVEAMARLVLAYKPKKQEAKAKPKAKKKAKR